MTGNAILKICAYEISAESRVARFSRIRNIVLNQWDHADSNRRPLACQANALNQLSYDPFTYRATVWPRLSKTAQK